MTGAHLFCIVVAIAFPLALSGCSGGDARGAQFSVDALADGTVVSRTLAGEPAPLQWTEEFISQAATDDGIGLSSGDAAFAVLRFDPRTGALVDTVAVLPDGGVPVGLAFVPDGRLFISDFGRSRLFVLEPDAEAPRLLSVEGLAGPENIAIVPTESAAPQWFLDQIAAHTGGSGRWVADNSAYQSQNDPHEAYVIEWVSGFGGMTMTGRLYGIDGGKESPTFWEFRQYWHPGRNEAVIEQFGWGGAVGIGTVAPDGAADQTMYNADGSTMRLGHRSQWVGADTLVQESFAMIDGERSPRRTYTWIRQRLEDR